MAAIICLAQPGGHIGFGNTYTYSETDGIDEANFFACGIAGDGKVFFHAHMGSLFIKGNNYTRKVKFPAGALPIHIVSVLEKGNNQYVAFGDPYYYFIENDSITRACQYPEVHFDRFKIGNELVAHGRTKLYRFEKDSFVCKSTVPDPGEGVATFYADEDNNLWKVIRTGNKFDFFSINKLWKTKFQFSLYLQGQPDYIGSFNIKNPTHINLTGIGRTNDPNSQIVLPDSITPPLMRHILSPSGFQHTLLTDKKNPDKEKLHILHTDKLMTHNLFDAATRSFYFGTMNKPLRYFPYLKKYPRIFNHTSASAIHAIVQDSSGRIWVGSYEGGLSVIDQNKIVEYREDGLIFLPGPVSTRNHVYLISEKEEYGLLQYDMNGRKKILTPNALGFYTYLSKNKEHFYYGGTSYNGLWKTDMPSLESGNPVWKKIDSTKGNRLRSITSITEDAKGSIWMGTPNGGFAVHYPDNDKVTTWLIAKNEISFGFWSSCTDDKGTVWLGTGQKGLMFYNDYSSDTVNPKKIIKIEHPLLPDGTKIMQLVQWGKWLIMGTGKDVLLMDLEQWYKTNKAHIRYINPQEGNFNAPPEQNTILIDKRDSSVWFATSDMLYQWHIRQWLSLPVYTVKPNLVWYTATKDSALTENQFIKIKPTDNTLTFSVWFQSRDNMPRYMSVALIKSGDSLLFPAPSLQTKFEYANLASGNYELVIQICQSSGTVSIHQYSIIVKKFWWQYWWVWLMGFIALFTPFAMWINSRRKTQLAEEKAKRKEAELETLKAEQQKKLSNLQIVSLSNQFRPHFILNALNTVGAELDNRPQAESVLSRLGESIDLIFSHAQNQKIAHSLTDEWKLVKNVIDIHQLMYLKQLETFLPSLQAIQQLSDIQIPLGLLQIPVENALLHGLSNLETGPWKLVIEIEEWEKHIIIYVTDNGVGRSKAATLSNYRKHGTGTKNLNGILDIVNSQKNEKINISYDDGIFSNETEAYGTKAIITIPKDFQYEI